MEEIFQKTFLEFINRLVNFSELLVAIMFLAEFVKLEAKSKKTKKMLSKVLIIMSLILGITCGVAIGFKLPYCIGIKLEMIMMAFCYVIMKESFNEIEREQS